VICGTFGPLAAIGAALGAVIGHMFPIWLSFRGGKGVATTLGVMWGLSWPVGAIACAAWLLLAALFRYSSLAALFGIAAGAVAAWLLADWRIAAAATALVPLVWIRHHENIGRLLRGTEPKIGQRSKAKESPAT
jgi:glycerol-3-phosphate acyltransferase PlsY